MKILKLPPYYYPERISSSYLTIDLEKKFIVFEYEFVIYAPSPTVGISKEIRLKYKNMKYDEKFNGKIKVHRFSMFREKTNSVQRAIRYILCNFIQYFKAIKTENIDLIYAASTPPTQGLLCSLVKKRLKVPFVYNLQDMFPESLVSTGLTKKNSLIWKIGNWISNVTYKNADKIIVITKSMREVLIKKGIPAEKIEVVYNWIDGNEVRPIERNANRLFDEFCLPREKFYITYAGNLGNSQNIEIILKTAKNLRDYQEIVFVIIGDGTQKQNCMRWIEQLRLKNVKMFPLQDYSRVSEVYSLGNASIVSCKQGVGAGALPSKTLSIMSAQRPIISSFDINSELTTIIQKAQCGICCDADDDNALTQAILTLYNNKKLELEMGLNARKYVLEHFTSESQTQKYVDIVNDVLRYQTNL